MTDRSGSQWEQIQEHVESFEKLWTRGPRPRIADHLPDEPSERLAVLVELVHADLEFRLKAGELARVEDYLGAFPELRGSSETVLDLIQTEWTVRKRRDRNLKLDRYRERFPNLADKLKLKPVEGSTIVDVEPPGPVEPHPTVVVDGGVLPRRLGKYELRQRVGAGSFGVVYRAWDMVLRREVAVKLPKAEAQSSPGDIRVFLREARNAIDLRHPNIVIVHDAGPIDGVECVVRAFIEGGTLAERLREGPIEPEKAAELIVFVANALHYAHEKGIIHRDLKPSNILIDLDGRPHLADFGLARREAGDSTLSPSGVVGPIIGTPAYMAPEQARGDAVQVDARSDVYSAGVVLYEMLTGTTPFRGRGRVLQVQIEEAEPTAPRLLNEDVPADLESICLRTLAKSPEDRYPSASALAIDIQNFLNGRPILPRSEPKPDRGHRWPRLDRWPIALAMVAIGLSGWLGTVLGSRHVDNSQRPEEALQSLRDVASHPYTRGLDGPEAHRRLTDLARNHALVLARTLGNQPGLERLRAEVLVEVARRASDVGSDRQTSRAWEEAIPVVEVLLPRHPDDQADLASGLAELARIEARAGRLEKAKTLRSRALDLRREIREARSASMASRPPDIGRMLDLAEAIVEQDIITREAGKTEEIEPAETLARRVAGRSDLGLVDGLRLARVWLALARRDRELGQPRRAIPMARQALSLAMAVPGDGPLAVEMAHAKLLLGLAYRDSDQFPESLDNFQAAARAFEKLVLDEPLVDDHARDLASAEFEAGLLVEALGRRDEAITLFWRVVRSRELIQGRHPARAEESARLAETWSAIGSALDRQGRPIVAASAFARAVLEDLRAATLAPGERTHRSAMAEHARSARTALKNLRFRFFSRG